MIYIYNFQLHVQSSFHCPFWRTLSVFLVSGGLRNSARPIEGVGGVGEPIEDRHSAFRCKSLRHRWSLRTVILSGSSGAPEDGLALSFPAMVGGVVVERRRKYWFAGRDQYKRWITIIECSCWVVQQIFETVLCLLALDMSRIMTAGNIDVIVLHWFGSGWRSGQCGVCTDGALHWRFGKKFVNIGRMTMSHLSPFCRSKTVCLRTNKCGSPQLKSKGGTPD